MAIEVIRVTDEDIAVTLTDVGIRGRAGLVFRGDYDNSVQYYQGDAVRFSNNLYIATGTPAVGTDPTDSLGNENEGWELLVIGSPDQTAIVDFHVQTSLGSIIYAEGDLIKGLDSKYYWSLGSGTLDGTTILTTESEFELRGNPINIVGNGDISSRPASGDEIGDFWVTTDGESSIWDGTQWLDVHTKVVTTTTDGLMTSGDKVKLDGIESDSDINAVIEGSFTGNTLTISSTDRNGVVTDDTTIPSASDTVPGLATVDTSTLKVSGSGEISADETLDLGKLKNITDPTVDEDGFVLRGQNTGSVVSYDWVDNLKDTETIQTWDTTGNTNYNDNSGSVGSSIVEFEDRLYIANSDIDYETNGSCSIVGIGNRTQCTDNVNNGTWTLVLPNEDSNWNEIGPGNLENLDDVDVESAESTWTLDSPILARDGNEWKLFPGLDNLTNIGNIPTPTPAQTGFVLRAGGNDTYSWTNQVARIQTFDNTATYTQGDMVRLVDLINDENSKIFLAVSPNAIEPVAGVNGGVLVDPVDGNEWQTVGPESVSELNDTLIDEGTLTSGDILTFSGGLWRNLSASDSVASSISLTSVGDVPGNSVADQVLVSTGVLDSNDHRYTWEDYGRNIKNIQPYDATTEYLGDDLVQHQGNIYISLNTVSATAPTPTGVNADASWNQIGASNFTHIDDIPEATVIGSVLSFTGEVGGEDTYGWTSSIETAARVPAFDSNESYAEGALVTTGTGTALAVFIALKAVAASNTVPTDDGVNWEILGPERMSNLGDVVLTSESTKDLLQFNGTNWVNVSPASVGSDLILANISDVTTPVSGTDNNRVLQAVFSSGTPTYSWVDRTTNTTTIQSYDATQTYTAGEIVYHSDQIFLDIHTSGTNLNKEPGTTGGESFWQLIGPETFEQLEDSAITSPNTDQFIIFNGTNWINTDLVTETEKLVDLFNLKDVDGTAVSNSVLRFDDADSTWKPVTPASLAGNMNITDLGDVDNTINISSGDFLQRNASGNFVGVDASEVAGQFTINEINDVTLGTLANEDILQRSGDDWVNRTPTEVASTLDLDELKDVGTVADGEFLQKNGTSYDGKSVSEVAVQIDTGELKDVTLTTPSQNDLLQRDGSDEWINRSAADVAGTMTLENVGNVSDTVADTSILQKDGTDYVARTPANIVGQANLDDLSDITAPTTVESGRVLRGNNNSGTVSYDWVSNEDATASIQTYDDTVSYSTGDLVLSSNSIFLHIGSVATTGTPPPAAGVNSTVWELLGPETIEDINGVTANTNAASGDLLSRSGTGDDWVNVTPAVMAESGITLENLNDIPDLPTSDEDLILQRNAAGDGWEFTTLADATNASTGGVLIQNLSDVSEAAGDLPAAVPDNFSGGKSAVMLYDHDNNLWKARDPRAIVGEVGLEVLRNVQGTIANGSFIQKFDNGFWSALDAFQVAEQFKLGDLGDVVSPSTGENGFVLRGLSRATTLAGAINAGDFSSITVGSTDGFSASGSVEFANRDVFNYESITDTTFVNTTTDQTLGAHADGEAISQVLYNWVSNTQETATIQPYSNLISYVVGQLVTHDNIIYLADTDNSPPNEVLPGTDESVWETVGPESIEKLTGVTITSGANGDLLQRTGEDTWANITPTAMAEASIDFTDLKDIDFTPAANQLLQRNSANDGWNIIDPSAMAEAGISITDLSDIDVTPAANQIIKRNAGNTAWEVLTPAQIAEEGISFTDLSDIDFTPAANQMVKRNAANTAWEVLTPAEIAEEGILFTDLNDIDFTPAANELLQRNSANTAWIVQTPAQVAEAGIAFTDLSDIDVTAGADQILQRNAGDTEWEATTLATATNASTNGVRARDLSDVTGTPGTNELLQFSGTEYESHNIDKILETGHLESLDRLATPVLSGVNSDVGKVLTLDSDTSNGATYTWSSPTTASIQGFFAGSSTTISSYAEGDVVESGGSIFIVTTPVNSTITPTVMLIPAPGSALDVSFGLVGPDSVASLEDITLDSVSDGQILRYDSDGGVDDDHWKNVSFVNSANNVSGTNDDLGIVFASNSNGITATTDASAYTKNSEFNTTASTRVDNDISVQFAANGTNVTGTVNVGDIHSTTTADARFLHEDSNWNGNIAYTTNDIITSAGTLFRAVQDAATAFVVDQTYQSPEVVSFGGFLYQWTNVSSGSTSTDPAQDTSNWSLFTKTDRPESDSTSTDWIRFMQLGDEGIPAYRDNVTYTTNDIVEFGGAIFRANASITQGQDPSEDTTNWLPVASSTEFARSTSLAANANIVKVENTSDDLVITSAETVDAGFVKYADVGIIDIPGQDNVSFDELLPFVPPTAGTEFELGFFNTATSTATVELTIRKSSGSLDLNGVVFTLDLGGVTRTVTMSDEAEHFAIEYTGLTINSEQAIKISKNTAGGLRAHVTVVVSHNDDLIVKTSINKYLNEKYATFAQGATADTALQTVVSGDSTYVDGIKTTADSAVQPEDFQLEAVTGDDVAVQFTSVTDSVTGKIDLSAHPATETIVEEIVNITSDTYVTNRRYSIGTDITYIKTSGTLPLYYKQVADPSGFEGLWLQPSIDSGTGAVINPNYFEGDLVAFNNEYYVAEADGQDDGDIGDPSTVLDGEGERLWRLVDINPENHSNVWKLVLSPISVIDNLTTADTRNALSANQGKVLSDELPSSFDNTSGYANGSQIRFEGKIYTSSNAITEPVSPAVLTDPDSDTANWSTVGGFSTVTLSDQSAGNDDTFTIRATNSGGSDSDLIIPNASGSSAGVMSVSQKTHLDSLLPPAWKGTSDTTTSYSEGDQVSFNSKVYYVAGISIAATEIRTPSNSNSGWTPVDGEIGIAWNKYKAYSTGDMVSHGW